MLVVAGCDGLYSSGPDAGSGGGAAGGGSAGGGIGTGGGTATGGGLGSGGGIGAGGGGGHGGFGGGGGFVADGGNDDAGPSDAGSDAGTMDAGAPVTLVNYNWKLKGSDGEVSVGAAATPTRILWLRYVYGVSGKITTIDRPTGVFVSTQVTDIGPANIMSLNGTVAFAGRDQAAIDQWQVQWLTADGQMAKRSESMVLVYAGGIVSGAMFEDPDAGPTTHVVSPKTASGTHVSALSKPDGGVKRTESPCGNVVWWDGATAGDSPKRFFIGAINTNQCDFGGSQFFGPLGGNTFRHVLVRYAGVAGVPGVPTVRELPQASGAIRGPSALGATASSVWIAYYAPTGHLRLEQFSTDTVLSQGAVQAAGQPYITGKTDIGLEVYDVVPHPTRNRVYVLVTVYDSKSTWANEVTPPLIESTLAIYTFDSVTKALLGVKWVPSSNTPKIGSQMALIDDQLVVTGQCDLTPAGGTTDPLCSPTPTSNLFSFIFSTPAP